MSRPRPWRSGPSRRPHLPGHKAPALGLTSSIGLVAGSVIGTGVFPAGSMAPKADAACRFVEGGGRLAAFGRLEDPAALAANTAGTIVRGA